MTIAAALVAVGLLAWAGYEYRNCTLLNITWGGAIGAIAFFAAVAVVPLMRFLNPQSAARGVLLKFALPLVGWIVANLHLWLIDPLFQKRGQINRLLKLPADDS